MSEIELIPTDDDGFEVRGAGFIGYVYPDWFGGWRPYSIYGRCLTSGRPAHSTPMAAALWNDD